MNRISILCKRPFVRLARFRHRCGYGVHSPFAFHLITGIIYETAPYYKYASLLEGEKRQATQHPSSWREEPLRVKRLLFRLVNYARPETIVDAGPLSASGLYLKAGREGAAYTQLRSWTNCSWRRAFLSIFFICTTGGVPTL